MGCFLFVFFFKQKTAYEMRISDWSSDVCSSDLPRSRLIASHGLARLAKSTPAAAENALPRFAQALGFTEEDRGRVLYQVALWTAASYEPESARRLAAVPASAYDRSEERRLGKESVRHFSTRWAPYI